jgi:hypothetical protein
MEIEIEIKTLYGVAMNYPVNRAAKALAEIAGTKTLTDRALALIQSMGATVVEIVPKSKWAKA